MRAFLQTCCFHRLTYFIVHTHTCAQCCFDGFFGVREMGAAAARASEDVATCGYDSYFEVVGCRASFGRCKKRGCHFSQKNNTFWGFLFRTRRSCRLTRRLYGFWKPLVNVAVHLTRPIMKVQPLFVKIPARVNHQIRTVRTGKFLSFSWFSFCVVYPFSGRVPSTMWDLCGKPSHLGVGSGLPRPFGLLKF